MAATLKAWKRHIIDLEEGSGRKIALRRAFNRTLRGGAGKTGYDIVANISRVVDGEKRMEVFRKQFVPFMRTVLAKNDAGLRRFVAENERRFGVRPGTQIYYKGAFGTDALQHHGVFLGAGLVCEVGGKWCKVKAAASGFLEQCLSINTLEDFVVRGRGKIFKIEYAHLDMDDMGTLREQLERAMSLTDKSDWDYNPFTNNCQHWSSFVTTGERVINQCDLRRRRFKEIPVELPKSEKCKRLGAACAVMHRTQDGRLCESAVKSSLAGPALGAWCYTNEKEGEWDRVGDQKPVYACRDRHKVVSCLNR